MSEPSRTTDEERRPDWAALLIGLGLVGLGGLVGADALRLAGGAYARVGPTAFPYAIAACLVGLGAWTLVEAYRGRFPEREKDEIAPIAWIVGGLAAQLLLLNYAGFSIATGLLFAATARAFGKRRLWMTVPIGILTSLVIWYVFSQVLRLRLPAGPLENLLV